MRDPCKILVRLLAAVAMAVGVSAKVSAQEAGTGRFLLISDIHFDPFADPALFPRLAASPAEDWDELLASRPSGFSPRGSDTNHALLRTSLDDARRRLLRPDFVLYPGDFLAHGWQAKYDRLAPRSHLDDPAAYRDFTARTIQYLADEFRRRFPEVPILPTLGNEDSYCGDYMVEPDGRFLSMFAEVWAPLLGPGADLASFRETFGRGGSYTVRLPGLRGVRLVVLNSVFFSVSYCDACGPGTRTPALDELDWLDRTLTRVREEGETAWLLLHIPPGINSYNSVEEVQKGGPPVTFWQPELTARFLQLVERHRTVLKMAFAGHTHMDDFRVVRLADVPTLLLKIAPAISPIFGNNPGYQVYRYDREAGVIADYETYYLTNLEAGPNPAAVPAGSWALEYGFREGYGAAGFDAVAVSALAGALRTDPERQRRYTTWYGVSAPPEFDAAGFEVYRCAIANVTPGGYLTCLAGSPQPKAPPFHSDRRVRPATVPK